MKTKFEDFLIEYTGPYKAAGFKFGDKTGPGETFDMDCVVVINPTKDKEEVKNKIEEILKQYDVDYESISIDPLQEDAYTLNMTFKSYNQYEAHSVINTVLVDALKKLPDTFNIDLRSLKFQQKDAKPIEPEPRYMGTRIGFGR